MIIAWYLYHWKRLKWLPNNTASISTGLFFSVIVPARNEVDHIIACLDSILQQDFPQSRYEVILIDDHSTDHTAQVAIQHFGQSIQVLKLADYTNPNVSVKAFKKAAIQLGIQKAKGDIIVTTDADCKVPKQWLLHFEVAFQAGEVKMAAAPVNFDPAPNAIEHFQALDFLGMMVITGAGIQSDRIRMCNGANLAYRKSAFLAVNGFDQINHISSGDDILLMQKIAAVFPQSIRFIKTTSATVFTSPKPTLQAFFQQRLRWATKSNAYQEKLMILILGIVFLNCITIWISPFLVFFWHSILPFFIVQLFVKVISDYFLLREATRFFNQKHLMQYFATSQLLHILYISVIGIWANIQKEYYWKGRRVK